MEADKVPVMSMSWYWQILKMSRACWLYILLQVDYGSTAEELEAHFHGCGAVSRVTILCNKFTGHPKGLVFCYVSNSLWILGRI